MRSWNAFRTTPTKLTGRPSATPTEYVAFDVRADRPYRLGLIGLPVGMQAKKDRVAERVTDRREDGFPRA